APSVIRNPPGMLLWATPGWALDSTTTEAIRKMMVRIGNAYRSKYCTRLWPKNATTTCTSTTMTRQAGLARGVSVLSANVALTLFTANQPIPAGIALSPAGSPLAQVVQGVERDGVADAVPANPADPGGDRVQPGRQHVAPVAEAEPAQHHLRDPEQWSLLGQQTLGDAAERGADHDGQERLPEAEAERGHAQHAHEDRGELHVR